MFNFIKKCFNRIFPVGSRSLLFGVHQIFWHPYTVYKAWVYLYGKPTWKEAVCIFIHDWGYWNCSNMDGEEGERHPITGAKIAGFLFGKEYYDLVLLHSRHYSKMVNREPSKLCWADKLSMRFDNKSFYLFRAKMTGEIHEYRNNSAHLIPLEKDHSIWFEWLRDLMGQLGEDKREIGFRNGA